MYPIDIAFSSLRLSYAVKFGVEVQFFSISFCSRNVEKHPLAGGRTEC